MSVAVHAKWESISEPHHNGHWTIGCTWEHGSGPWPSAHIIRGSHKGKLICSAIWKMVMTRFWTLEFKPNYD